MMNDSNLIIPLIGVALFTSMVYIRGRKKNRWISGWISRESEDALKPIDTHYVNYGGAIGYNFVYKMHKPYREAKGTFTLLPRHSAFFLPISLLFFTRHDRYYLHLYVDGKLAGEGHIVAGSYFSKAAQIITGIDGMQREDFVCKERRYVLLWKGKGMDERLRMFIDKVEHSELLVHFCCYSGNRNFFLYVRPLRQKLEELLKSVMPGLKQFFLKGAGGDEPGNTNEN